MGKLLDLPSFCFLICETDIPMSASPGPLEDSLV